MRHLLISLLYVLQTGFAAGSNVPFLRIVSVQKMLTYEISRSGARSVYVRGYTFHEHLPKFGLINLNGRVYVPETSQFLRLDLYTQSYRNWLNYNPYVFCSNNLIYTDSSGVIIWFLIIVGAITDDFTNVVTNTGHINNNAGRFFGYMSIGAAAGALGGYAGGAVSSAVGGVGAISGSISGAASGAVSGFAGAAGNAWMGGSNFGDGLISGFKGAGSGALTGGLTGGVSSGISSIRRGGNFFTGKGAMLGTISQVDDKPITVGEEMEYSTGYANDFSDKYLNTIKEKPTNLYADGRVPAKLTKNGDIVLDAKGKSYSGVTIYRGISKGSDVYLFKQSFTSKDQLYMVMGHEYIHVYFNANGYGHSAYENPTERAAYKWNIDQAKAWGLDPSNYIKLRNQYSNNCKTLYHPNSGITILPARPW